LRKADLPACGDTCLGIAIGPAPAFGYIAAQQAVTDVR
jgi:hypothetical protein